MNKNTNLSITVWIRRLTQIFVTLVLQMLVLFVAAGSADWPMAWGYFGLSIIMVAINSVLLYKKNPGLIAERSRLNKKTKGWDKIVAPLVGLLGPLATLLVAGLDRRFGWTSPLPQAAIWSGVVIFALGMAFLCWAMVENRFFACTVAIQDNRGHSVISSGPYGIVRHPGYTAIGFNALATPIMLNSLTGLIPAAFNVAVIIIRTALEDRMLQNELPGYSEYTHKTRYRLIPGLW